MPQKSGAGCATKSAPTDPPPVFRLSAWGGGKRFHPFSSPRGLSLLELIAAMGIVLVLATLAQPLVVNASKRARDAQLKRTLRDVRAALDAFHEDWKQHDGLLCNKAVSVCRKVSSQDGFPRQLDTLLKVDYVDTTIKPPPPPPPGEEGEKPKVKTERRVYLRKALLTDPITGAAWQLRCYDDPPDAETWCGKDVYDVRTTSDLKGLDGTPYNTW